MCCLRAGVAAIVAAAQKGQKKMIVQQFLTQPAGRSQYVSLFRTAFEGRRFSAFDAAVAYATNGGVDALVSTLREAAGWEAVPKRWLIGIDWCRTEPVALERLAAIAGSTVRVFDGAGLVNRRECVPIIPFHPKTFILRGDDAIGVVCGSGNLSRNGMTVGHEVGSVIVAAQPLQAQDQEVWDSCHSVSRWFDLNWRPATPVERVLAAYRRVHESVPHLHSPTVTDEDTVPPAATTRRSLTADQLRQLRAAQHFWIQAGNLHKNRGPARPGNQLMLSPMMRVFFGFPARDLARDTFIGDVSIQYRAHRRNDCSLRFSNNSMDVLTLPLPGTEEGPPAYDQETLLFEKEAERRGLRFVLRLGTPGERNRWRQRSQRVDGHYRMSSGREWGVF